MITLLAGQILGGLLMSHFGWLGSPVQPVTMTKLAGVLVMIGGVYWQLSVNERRHAETQIGFFGCRSQRPLFRDRLVGSKIDRQTSFHCWISSARMAAPSSTPGTSTPPGCLDAKAARARPPSARG
jgi:hypothetical protein